MATMANLALEQEAVETVVNALDRPAGVALPRIEFTEDHSGDPAIYLTFPVSMSIPLTEGRSLEILSFTDDVRNKLYAAQVERLIYVLISEAT